MPRPRNQKTAAVTALLRSKILRMRDRDHLSQREIGRRLGISESFVRDIIKGRRNVSAKRGIQAGLRPVSPAVSQSKHAKGLTFRMKAFVAGENRQRSVRPATRKDASKIGRYMNRMKKARQEGDFTILTKELPKSDFTVSTSEGTLHLESDPYVLRELDEAGNVKVDDIVEY